MLVLLTSWLSLCDHDPCYQVVELFAGAARICKLAKAIGLAACAHDITYDVTAGNGGSSFNILGCAGFVLLGFLLGSKSDSLLDLFFHRPHILGDADLRLAIHTVLCGKMSDLILVMGICCSTFVNINMGTSGRDVLNPEGNTGYTSVSMGNSMVSRKGLANKNQIFSVFSIFK